ncbi:MAG: plasmid stabilization protein [Gammaproteobacteria bacterium HGW-Gammaproteobacteria-10]|nr:MAG: plasmid stabilization protein [Gammaproteobacteria bacterium HGW-Gammaproteobacteria-10]
MKLKISKRFVKDSEKITDKRLLKKLHQVLIEAGKVENLSDISNITQLSGYPNYYRIKFDYRYRIGLYFDGETLEFLRIGTREDFYKRFP